MSKKRKNPHLTAKQKAEKKKMLLSLEKEIKQLEFDLKHTTIANTRIKTLRDLKILLKFGQLIAPYTLTAAITFGGFSVLGGTPFIKDDRKLVLNEKKEFDSLGNIKYEQQYDKFDNINATITYFDKWTKKEDGFYSRETKTYSADKLAKEVIERMINEQDIDSLNELCTKPISSSIQIQNNLTDEEIEQGPFFKAIVYSRDKNDYIIAKESLGEEFGLTTLWLLLLVILEPLTYELRRTYSDFDFNESIHNIKSKYQLMDVDDFTKKLEIKKSNYRRLTR